MRVRVAGNLTKEIERVKGDNINMCPNAECRQGLC